MDSQSQLKTLTFNRLPILGNTNISFDEWKFSFDHWCNTFKITEEEEKIDYLFAITDKTARTIVYNSLNKKVPDSYDTILKNLGKYYKKSTSKNSNILELSSITIRRDETITDFDLRFSEILNQVSKSVTISEIIVTSYYINAFRNWSKIYECLMEEEPTTLEEAMKITGKKEKIMKLTKENKRKMKEKAEVTKRKPIESYNNNYKPVNNYNNNKNFYRNKSNEQNKEQNKEPFKNKFYNQDKEKQYSNNNEIDEITKKLSELNINFCVNCLRIGHNVNECEEKVNGNESETLN